MAVTHWFRDTLTQPYMSRIYGDQYGRAMGWPAEAPEPASTTKTGPPTVTPRREQGFMGSFEAEGGGGFRVTAPSQGMKAAPPGSNFRLYPALGRTRQVPSLRSARSSTSTGRTLRRPSLSELFYGNRTPSGILSTGFGSTRPKLLSFRNFTSKWTPGPGGLLQPNPAYMGINTLGYRDRFDPSYASQMGFGRMPAYTDFGRLAKATV